jgi:shikimate kinase
MQTQLPRPIALIGMPGGGKSTVGRQLARHLNVPFVDSDVEIEKRIGCSIRAFFEREGEARFREVEQEIIAELLCRKDAVVATGGGVVLRDANRAVLHDNANVVYLRSTAEELFRRLRHDTRRPLLQVADPLRKLRQLYAERDPLYRQTAHFVIETGRPSVSTLVNMILMQLELAGVIDPDRVPSSVLARPGG